jgi:hypothetical protein
MASIAATRIDAFLKEHIHPVMLRHGYRRRGRTWAREVGDLWWVVNVQSNKHNNQLLASFMVNLAVCIPPVHRLQWGRNAGAWPSEIDGTVRERLGILMPQTFMRRLRGRPSDRIWDVGAESERLRAIAEVPMGIERYGLPFLAQFNTVEYVRRWLDDRCGEPWMGVGVDHYAALLVHLGDIDGATSVMRRHVKWLRKRGWLESSQGWLHEVSQRLGIGLDLPEQASADSGQ